MKKVLSALCLLAILMTLLSGCSKKKQEPEAPQPTLTADQIIAVTTDGETAPAEESPVASEDTGSADADMLSNILPADESANTEEGNTTNNQGTSFNNGYSMATVPVSTFGFSVNYPDTWVNHPGQFTICYSDDNGGYKVPPRFAVTKKTLRHTPKSTRVLEQFETYGTIIKGQYNSKDFEWEEMNEDALFLGLPAYEITYLTYINDVEVKGYMICTNVGMDLYVYHFYCAYKDYDNLSMLRLSIRDSIYVPMEDNGNS